MTKDPNIMTRNDHFISNRKHSINNDVLLKADFENNSFVTSLEGKELEFNDVHSSSHSELNDIERRHLKNHSENIENGVSLS